MSPVGIGIVLVAGIPLLNGGSKTRILPAKFWVIPSQTYKFPLASNSTSNGYVLLHRVLMENHLGRLLNAEEVVHHIDGDKMNNVLNNLLMHMLFKKV